MDIVKIILKTRGYEQVDSNEEGTVWKRNDDDIIFLFLKIFESIQVRIVDMVVKILNIYKINHGILVYTSSTSSSVKARLESFNGIKIELFHSDQLSCNIMEHVFQPRMTKCNVEQIVKVKNLYRYAMPQIKSDDPVVLWMDWKSGDIIAICDKKCTNMLDENGRCCIDCRWRVIC